MNTGNFNSKKYMIILVSVCVILMILTIKAFDYMESPITDNITDNNNVNKSSVYDINDSRLNLYNSMQNKEVKSGLSDNKDDEEFANNDEQHKTGHFDFMPKSSYRNDNDNFEEIPAPEGADEDVISSDNENNDKKLSKDEQALKYITNAKGYKNSNDISNALAEYQLAADIADDKEIKAMSYEAIAEIYASQRRFGTALAFASKANNIAPSTSREMLIARINYKAGKTQSAINTTNNVMKKGF